MSNIIPIVSFPKSGNTWLRFIIANLYKKDRERVINFKNINNYSCTSFSETSKINKSLLIADSPLFVKQHANFSDITHTNFEKAIYIYRNGFDVLVSYKHFTDAQNPGLYKNFRQFVKFYWSYCGHWGDHINSWVNDTNQNVDVFSFSYEDLKTDTFNIVKRMVEFLETDFSDEEIKEAIKASSKDKMKSLSGSKEFMKSKKANFHFVRSGIIGEGKNMNEENKQIFISHDLNYQMMRHYGYLSKEEMSKKYNSTKFYNIYNRIYSKLLLKYYFLKNIIYRNRFE